MQSVPAVRRQCTAALGRSAQSRATRFSALSERTLQVRTNIVFTLTGTDRVGIVDEITQMLLDYGGNIETSRMTRLGGEFAILVLLSLPSERLGTLEKAIPNLITQGYKVTTTRTEQRYAEDRAGWLPFQVDLRGADHEGIIHEIAHTLSGAVSPSNRWIPARAERRTAVQPCSP